MECWEYAVLWLYKVGSDDFWAIQTSQGLEHDKRETDELGLLNDLGRKGWRVHLYEPTISPPQGRLLNQLHNETAGISIVRHWLLERRQ